MLGKRRMSMLDFGFSYYLGDPYFDILYYITIPPARFGDWTFQRRLLAAFLSEVENERQVNSGRFERIRLILLCCNIARYSFFKDHQERQRIYADNIRDLLDANDFEAFWRTVIS